MYKNSSEFSPSIPIANHYPELGNRWQFWLALGLQAAKSIANPLPSPCLGFDLVMDLSDRKPLEMEDSLNTALVESPPTPKTPQSTRENGSFERFRDAENPRNHFYFGSFSPP